MLVKQKLTVVMVNSSTPDIFYHKDIFVIDLHSITQEYVFVTIFIFFIFVFK